MGQAAIVLAVSCFGALASPVLAGDAAAPPPASPAPAAAADAAKPVDALSALPAIPAGMARLIVIRLSSFRGAVIKARIRAGGTTGWIGNGSVAVLDIAPGSLDVQIDNPLNFGHTSVPVAIAAGETQFMQIKPTIYGLGLLGAEDFAEMRTQHQVCQKDWCADLMSAEDGRVVAGTLPVVGPQTAKDSK